MKLIGILPFARFLLEQALSKGDIAIDCTVGKGHDTLFLSSVVGQTGHVYGFDIQAEAISHTLERLAKQQINNVTLHQTSHEQVRSLIPAHDHHKVKAAIFNLGYLPGGDKPVVTKPSSTLSAIRELLAFMPSGGTIVIVIYHGHTEGKVEKEMVESFAEQLDQQKAHVLRYEFINQANNPPFIVAVEKR